ncbi:BBE domain-containing protein [Actinospica durhamensis]|uniref:BBE domain-containing protein n=1 Tax=Actinospica durhamensis TaxID=1508375 RepID=A0A941IUI2_9ACTN|nr:BBE domain-containing protein [Actinospica durhamensis]MBR7835586.1 BBE domain-containing protein [Actinospica durhamensis]
MAGMMSRRTALRRGATVATAGLAAAGVPVLVTVPEARAAVGEGVSTPWDKLAELLDEAGAGRLFEPAERLFGTLGVPRNHVYIDNRPLRILAPRDIDGDRGATGVEIAVAWAGANGVRVIPYSNGHNYAGYSATDPRDACPTLLVDLSDNQLKQPALADGAGGTVVLTAGSGTTNGDAYPFLRTNPFRGRQWAVPTGRCPTVALGGLTLGGGIGFSDRKYGLTCDTLVATTVVTPAYGKVVATADQHSDLFWACRGGAGNNFGIHVDFTYAAHPVPDRFCVFDLKWQAADLAAKAWSVYDAFRRLLFEGDQSDPRLADFHLRFGIGTAGRDQAEAKRNARCNALGEFYGSKRELIAFLESRGLPADLVADFESGTQDLNFWDATNYTFATTPIYQWGSKSAIVDERDVLDEARIATCVRYVQSWPGSHNDDGAGIALFALGAKINEKDPTATAFWHRRAQFIMALESSWADNDSTDLADPTSTAAKCQAWLDDFYLRVWGEAGPSHCYQNFPDPDLTDWQARYYGGNYARLREVKTKYDPDGMFHYEQGIQALRPSPR